MRRLAILAAFLAVHSSANADSVDWSGGYLGAFAGAARVDSDVSSALDGQWNATVADRADRDAVLPLLNRDLSKTGALGGVVIGYNLAYDGLVLGVEADVSVLDGGIDRTSYNAQTGPALAFRVDTEVKVDWLATLRGRLGWTFGRSLIYATAGLAVGEHKFDQTIAQLDVAQFRQTGAFSKTSAGWVVGAGAEYALSSNWALRLQYLHVDLGSHRADSAGTCLTFPALCAEYTGTHKADAILDVVTAGVNYRF